MLMEMAGSGRDAEQGHDNTRWTRPDLEAKAQQHENGVSSLPSQQQGSQTWAESQLQQRNPAFLFWAQIPRGNVGQVAHIPPTPWVTSQEANITCRTPEAACWLWLGCWSNNVANSHPSPGPFDCRVLPSCLVPQCSYPPYWPHHQQRRANSDWMPASYTSGQTFNPCRHPTCCALAQGSHTISRTQCHGAWTPAPLSAHPAIGCSCTAPQIETPICARRTTTHQFFWQQQQHMCGVVGVGGQPHKTPHFNSRHRYTPLWNDPPKKSLGPAQPPPHRCRTFPLLPVKMGYGLLCGLWVWCRTNRRPCRPPPSNPWTLPRTTRPDGSGQWDNQMAAQHLPRYPGGLAVDKRTHSNERRRSHRYCLQGDFPMPTDTLVQNFLSFLIYT